MTFFCDTYLLLILGGVLINTSCMGSSWTYELQDYWSGECQTGKYQSPINLEYASAILEHYVPFNLADYNNQYKATVTNNGHSALLKFQTNGSIPQIRGGGLPDVYMLEQIHFHWESEHTIDSKRLPLEMHLVHYSAKYGNFNNAVLYDKGVAVLAVLFHISPDDDEYFEPFLELLPQIETNPNGVAVSVETPLIASTFLPRDRAGFFRYDGSLTTPSCNEGVIWTIFTNTLPISPSQAILFRKLWTEKNTTLVVNYRNLQPLNGRTVYLRESPVKQSDANILNIPLVICITMITMVWIVI